MDLDGRTVVVTAGASRIGRAVTIELARAGATVVIQCAESGAPAEATCAAVRDLGARCAVVVGDLGDASDVEHMADDAGARFGSVDALVNSAAVPVQSPIETLSEVEWERTLAANLRGPFFLAVRLGTQMLQGAGGAIVNVVDWPGLRPHRGELAHAVAQAGIVALTKGLAKALAPKVRVHGVVRDRAHAMGRGEPVTAPVTDRAALQGAAADDALARLVRLLIVEAACASGGIHVVGGGRLDA